MRARGGGAILWFSLLPLFHQKETKWKRCQKFSMTLFSSKSFFPRRKHTLSWIKGVAQCMKFLPIRSLEEGSDYIGSIVRTLILHCKMLFLQIEPVTTKLYGSDFIIVPRFSLTLSWINSAKCIYFIFMKSKHFTCFSIL